jgi:hypothetical protein
MARSQKRGTIMSEDITIEEILKMLGLEEPAPEESTVRVSEPALSEDYLDRMKELAEEIRETNPTFAYFVSLAVMANMLDSEPELEELVTPFGYSILLAQTLVGLVLPLRNTEGDEYD